MKVQQINTYQNKATYYNNFKNNYIKYDSSPNVYTNNISFVGIKGFGKTVVDVGGRFVSKGRDFVEGGIGKASDLIEKTSNEISASIGRHNKNIKELEGSYDDISKSAQENRIYIEQNYFFTGKKIRKATENELEAKERALLELRGAVDKAEIEAGTNRLKAEQLPIELAKEDKANAIRRRDMLKKMYPNEEHVGFERIVGYQDVKDTLTKDFIKAIDEEKEGKNVEIPGSFLFFGPTGNGKTTSAIAVAEETGCKLIKIASDETIIGDNEINTIFARIKQEASEAEDRFLKTKTRTILFIDEIDKFTDEYSPINAKFEEFVKTCSEKYHCTIFASTNHPSTLGINIKETFPVIISVDPPTRTDTVGMFKHYLQNRPIDGDIDYEILADTLIKTGEERGGMYSNSQIKNVINYTIGKGVEQKNSITQNDILSTIKNVMKKEVENNHPIITWKRKKDFDDDVKKFMTQL